MLQLLQQSVFPHVASIYANLLEQKKAFAWEKSWTPTRLVWDTNEGDNINWQSWWII